MSHGAIYTTLQCYISPYSNPQSVDKDGEWRAGRYYTYYVPYAKGPWIVTADFIKAADIAPHHRGTVLRPFPRDARTAH